MRVYRYRQGESLEAIGEAISENGRVPVTGCMGRDEDAETIRARHPKVLGISGPAAYEEVLRTVREVLRTVISPTRWLIFSSTGRQTDAATMSP